MERRSFLGGAAAGGALFGGKTGLFGTSVAHAKQSIHMDFADDILIERDEEGQPYKGKVLAAIQPHADDIPIFAGGLVAKLIKEGYTGYVINTTNDDHAGPGTVGDTVLANEQDWDKVAKALGLKKVFNLGYRNHRMEDIDIIEMKARLIFLFRALKIDTIITYDPYGHYEENPDHYVTAQAVEAACWMAGGSKDYPEITKAGIRPHGVREKYYHARGPQLINCVVDISSHIDAMIESNIANAAQGPAGTRGSRLKASLAKENKKLDILGDDDHTANFHFIKQFLLEDEKELGRKYGFEYAQAFHYIGSKLPPKGYTPTLNEYIEKNVKPLR
ncbi:PIG-L deacetylase family protein [Candidatus Latescibacterota bacterium]